MLAYVFSHRPEVGVDVASYEASLRSFHQLLAKAKPEGFISSSTFRLGGRYDDWYLLEGSAAMDVINHVALKDEQGRAHDEVAQMAADGYGKLYRLACGDPTAGEGYEVRLSKPPGTKYHDFYARLDPWTREPTISLWRRQMVLGPPPEFCLISDKEFELPADMTPELLKREPI